MIKKTKNGHSFFEVVSSLIKTIRRDYEEEALYWAFELEDNPRYLWKRLLIMAVEDIGLANFNAVVVVGSLKEAYFNGLLNDKGAGRLFIAMAVLYLCRSPKNRLLDYVVMEHFEKRVKGWKLEIPQFALDVHTSKGRRLGKTTEDFLTDGSLESNVVEVPDLVRIDSKERRELEENLKLSSKEAIRKYQEAIKTGQKLKV